MCPFGMDFMNMETLWVNIRVGAGVFMRGVIEVILICSGLRG